MRPANWEMRKGEKRVENFLEELISTICIICVPGFFSTLQWKG
jgi:hypothetical protein